MDINVATALIGALAGAATAGLFSVFAGALQSSREHDRWVRESRYAAYSDFLVAIDAWSVAATTDWIAATFTDPEAIAKNRDHTERLELELSRAQSKVVLIGPDVVRAAAEDYQYAMVEHAELARSVTRVEDATS